MKKHVVFPALVVAAFVAAGAPGCTAPTPPKVVVLGLDGLTWRFLDPLLAAGHLPHLEGVLEGAASGELETLRPTHSAILWTSVATGKTPSKHGITDWIYVDKDARAEIERLRLLSGIDRTATTVWEILGEQGLSVSVVNWWVTYPARPVNGVLVTDRLKSLMNKMSIADEPDLVYPPSLIAELRPMFLRPDDVNEVLDEFGFQGYSESRADEMFHTSDASRTLWRSLRSYVGQDRMVTDWALHLLGQDQPNLFAAIVRIPDVYAHFAWRFADRPTLERIIPQVQLESLLSEDDTVRTEAHELAAELDLALAEAMLPAYKFADEFVGSVVAAMEPTSILMVVSDHGFVWHSGAYDHNPTSRGPYPETSPPGVIIMKSPDIRPGRIEGAQLFDIAPTILYALGEPTAVDMDGRALRQAFSESGLYGGREEQFVSTYGVPQEQDAFPLGAAEQELIDDLRSLGYIGGGSSEPTSDEEAGGEPADANR